jgi:transposase
MERLTMQEIRDIVYRLRSGQSVRQIARDLQCSRTTVRRYHDQAEALGYLDPSKPLPTEEALLHDLGPASAPPATTSTVEPYHDLVVGWLDRGVEMAAIYERLRDNHGYGGSYSSVRRFARHLRPPQKRVCVRIETEPGQVAQVDFGGAGRIRNSLTGKVIQAYCFVMTLAYSRHQYVEIVFKQNVATWVECHRRAFAWFGGTPREIVIDNLKAAILRVALENPILCAPYAKMAQHYGFLIHPCRPRTPEHKGKVESGVHYVQRNLLAGADFHDEIHANAQARDWVMGRAGERMHGTTRQAPLLLFQEEKDMLLPLPTQPFELVAVQYATVHPDCHVTVEGAYYSVHHRYVGKVLEAHVSTSVVSLYDGVTLLVTHPRADRPGSRVTRTEHYPDAKAIYLRRTPKYCRQTAAQVGPSCEMVVDQLLSGDQPLDKLRVVQGLIGLIDRVGTERLEAACRRALAHNDPTLRRVRRILDAGTENVPILGTRPQSEAPRYEYERSVREFFQGLFDEQEVSEC